MSVLYLSKNEAQNFILKISSLIAKGIIVQVYISKPKEEAKSKKIDPCIKMLELSGIKVSLKENFSQKIAVIDEKILWYGNINFLGYTELDECCMRITNAQIASEVEGDIVSETW